MFHKSVLGRARFYRLRKKSVLHLIFGGAAVYRCDICIVLNAALAAEVAVFARGRLFPQPLLAVPLRPWENAGLSP